MDIKQTFKDMFQRRDRMLHELALWTELRTHTEKFLDGDTAPASIGIHSKGSGGVVPQDVIMEAQLQIDTTLDGLQKEIDLIEKTEVPNNEPSSEERPESEPAANGTAAGKKRRQAEPSAGTK